MSCEIEDCGDQLYIHLSHNMNKTFTFGQILDVLSVAALDGCFKKTLLNGKVIPT